MAVIIHKSELLRRALRYLDGLRAEKPEASTQTLLDETGMRFNLNPIDAENLERLLREDNRENLPDK